MKFAAETDRGLVRDINEDNYRIIKGSMHKPFVFIIADGMGGHNCGEIASKLAVEYISDLIENGGDNFSLSDDLENDVKKLLEGANRVVLETAQEYPAAKGMGTTLTMAVVFEKTATVAHVGDSRLYLARGEKILQITEDHSYIGELIKKGSLTKEEAERHPGKHVITRAIGSSPDLEVDVISLSIEKGDILVLCTDGLTNKVGENEIYNIVMENEPESACSELIEVAKNRGGEDNITVIVIKCE